MIKGLRVDHRLLHGQVAFSWTSYLEADCILIANDGVMQDELKKMAIKMAKPQGVKLVIKSIDDSITALNSGVTDKYKLFVVVESVKDAYRLMTETKQFHNVVLGGTKATENTKSISKAVNLTSKEIDLVKDLIAKDYEVEIRMVPTEKKVLAKDVI
ncbi:MULTISPECIES: PTS sugar transporter subunit IIB [Coprobacillaceae]|uniref:PTS sugar transporter subunit IIB n=1 Tax=Coprobacillaceae TaxID=2810280 RepID=UPI000E4E8C1C|nr:MULTISPECIES: PTS sugar transporter subunit IIB [Coprobacillaceae]RHM63202.1 PTS mannose/fructose/sorbose transporter subunit IIB [Coprobacillus sp. AF33-1AC]RHS93860.1 PTS mannose/fructose/sorbose transporter subunit IIB [Erysipelatoclostridium sp. AM42-17]